MPTLLCSLICLAGMTASDMEPIPDDFMIALGDLLSQKVEKIEGLPAKFEGDYDNAKGIARGDRKMGAVIVPTKGLKDDRDNEQLEKDKGVVAGLLVLYNLKLKDSPDAKDIFQIELADDEGQMVKVDVALLTIKKVSAEDFRLQVWGKKKEPLTEDTIDSEEEFGEAKVAIDYFNGELELIWLGRYPTSLFLTEVEPTAESK